MTTYAWPAALRASAFDWGIQKAGTQFTGPFNGTTQAIDYVAERWVVTVTLPPRARVDSGAVEAFFNRLAGGVHWVSLHHRARPQPVGTMRGTPTLSASRSRGNDSLLITTTAGATVKAGDMLGCGGHLFQVADDATANGSGAITVPVVNRVRSSIASGTAVTWNQPTATFILPAISVRHAHTPAILESGVFDLVEVW